MLIQLTGFLKTEWLISPDGRAVGDVRDRRADLWRPDGTLIAQVPLESREIACWPVTDDLFLVQRQPNVLERRRVSAEKVETFELRGGGVLFPGGISHDGSALITFNRAMTHFLYVSETGTVATAIRQ